MSKPRLIGTAFLAACLFVPGALAQGQDRVQSEVQQQDRIYGSELMTEQERNEYRDRMRSMQTEEERAALRAAHHEEMRKRAAAMGKELPEAPPASPGQKGKKSQGAMHGTPGYGPGPGGGNPRGNGAGSDSKGGKQGQ